jgi:hypothetical protein
MLTSSKKLSDRNLRQIPETGRRQRGPHELQELATVDGIQPARGLAGKLTVHAFDTVERVRLGRT